MRDPTGWILDDCYDCGAPLGRGMVRCLRCAQRYQYETDDAPNVDDAREDEMHPDDQNFWDARDAEEYAGENETDIPGMPIEDKYPEGEGDEFCF